MNKALFFVIFCLLSGTAFAAEHEIKAVGVKFDPLFLIVEKGDTVSWVNMPAHLIETIDQMVPEGQPKILSEMGVDVAYSLDHEGVFVYKCTPHWGARMGGIVLVGEPDDIPGILARYREEIKKDKSLKPAKGLLKKFEKFLKAEGKI